MDKELTKEQKAVIGKTVIAVVHIDYGFCSIAIGQKGVICDFFNAESEKPCIQWSDTFRGFVSWDLVKIVN